MPYHSHRLVEVCCKQHGMIISFHLSHTIGFSFGGLLACAIAACVWDLPYISSSLLKENLVCITFAQPHIPVPWLPEVAKECPDLVSTMHTVYWEGDVVPRLTMFLNECCSSLGSKESKASLQLKMRDQAGLVRNNHFETWRPQCTFSISLQ